MTDWTISEPPDNGALMLLDFQADFLDDNGRMPVCRSHVEPAIAAAAAAIRIFRERGRPIIAIRNEFRRRDLVMNLLRRYAAVAGSPGARWDPRLPLEGATSFAKWAASAFCNPELEPWLKEHGIGTLVICGLMARACVTATASEAIQRGFRVFLFGPAIACVSERTRARALARLERRGAALIS